MRKVTSLEQARDILMEAWAAGKKQGTVLTASGTRCALGEIYDVREHDGASSLEQMRKINALCPAYGGRHTFGGHILHLNDVKKWTFLQIAEWLDWIIQERSKQNVTTKTACDTSRNESLPVDVSGR